MPVSIVVGGQFGSEGKGKVAYEIARQHKSCVAVRVGGCNSGHTVIGPHGSPIKFQVLPTPSILPSANSVIAAGSYIDPDILYAEIQATGLTPDRLMIDENALLITPDNKEAEINANLREAIGSTNSGTGAAVISRLRRDGSAKFASEDQRLAPYICNARSFLRQRLNGGERVVIEGTQGFGLSPLHSCDYPNVTTRDTTAAGFLSETGLSPFDVDEIVMVIRAFPIRVAGNSGPLPNETDWETVTAESGYNEELVEYTTVTNNVRRVARFDAEVVKSSIEANSPSSIVLNHVDYVDAGTRSSHAHSPVTEAFVADIERQIDHPISFVGFGPSTIVPHVQNNPSAKYA